MHDQTINIIMSIIRDKVSLGFVESSLFFLTHNGKNPSFFYKLNSINDVRYQFIWYQKHYIQTKKDTDLRFYLDAVNSDGDVDDGILMHPGSFP